MSPSRSKHELANVQGPASNVASHEVGVHGFKVYRRKHVPRQNARHP